MVKRTPWTSSDTKLMASRHPSCPTPTRRTVATVAGHELRLTLNRSGMLPLPKSLPLAHADQLLDPDGVLASDSDFAGAAGHRLGNRADQGL